LCELGIAGERQCSLRVGTGTFSILAISCTAGEVNPKASVEYGVE